MKKNSVNQKYPTLPAHPANLGTFEWAVYTLTAEPANLYLKVGANTPILVGKAGITYKGTWNATTNTPAIVSSVGTAGDYYIVGVAGTTSINGISDWGVNDWIIFSGSTWQKIDNSETASPTASNGLTKTANNFKFGGEITEEITKIYKTLGVDKEVSYTLFDDTGAAAIGHSFLITRGDAISQILISQEYSGANTFPYIQVRTVKGTSEAAVSLGSDGILNIICVTSGGSATYAVSKDGITVNKDFTTPSARDFVQRQYVDVISDAVTALQILVTDLGTQYTSLSGYVDDIVNNSLNPLIDAVNNLAIGNILGLNDALDAKQSTSEKNATNGYVGLDANQQIRLGTSVIASTTTLVMTGSGNVIQVSGTTEIVTIPAPTNATMLYLIGDPSANFLISNTGNVRSITGEKIRVKAGACVQLVWNPYDFYWEQVNILASQFVDTNYYRNGNTYPITGFGKFTGNTVALGTTMKGYPFKLENDLQVSELRINVTTAIASSFIRCGIYEVDANFYPTTPIWLSGEINSGTTGVKNIPSSAFTFEANKIYNFVIQASITGVLVRGVDDSNVYPILPEDPAMGTAPYMNWSVTRTYAALPNPFTAGGTLNTTDMPLLSGIAVVA
jgi:hypothetical protein